MAINIHLAKAVGDKWSRVMAIILLVTILELI